MAKAKVADIRNVAFCGHGSSGKTTLVDHFLVSTGTVNANPSVDEGTSICDFDPEEKKHKYSIESTLVHFQHGGKRFHVFDTPGYPDFIGQTIAALGGVDTAVIVVNAQSGIEVNTRRVFEEAGKLGLGRMIVLSKLDGDNIDFNGVVEAIREMWGARCVLLNVPLGVGADFRGVASTLDVPDDTSGAVVDPNELHDPLVESIIEVDDEVMERYFEGEVPSMEELGRLMVRAVAAGNLVPILCCSAKKGLGVSELLDAVALCGLSPADRVTEGVKDGETVTIEPQADGPLVARVFKTRIDPFVQKLSFIRVFSGTLKRDLSVSATGARKAVKLGPLFEVQTTWCRSSGSGSR